MTGLSARRRAGLSLVEVLVALTVLAVAGAALASVQLGALRSGRSAQAAHVAAAALEQELLFQRVGPVATAGACVAAQLPHGWQCQVSTSCPLATFGCQLQHIQVAVTPPERSALEGVTVRFEPLVARP